MIRKLLLLALVGLFGCFPGCHGGVSREYFKVYVEADRAFYELAAPRLRESVAADTTLVETQREDWDSLIYGAGRRIDQGEDVLRELEGDAQ